ncbi:hypothetical protein ILFOPFJJ_03414 [Ensifer psoraleae]|nr:hypothetical protein [Sinorhizobium psoraleae]
METPHGSKPGSDVYDQPFGLQNRFQLADVDHRLSLFMGFDIAGLSSDPGWAPSA